MDQKTVKEVLQITEKLISIPSVSGHEHEVVNYLEGLFKSFGWPVQLMPVEDGRANVFVTFGKPEIVFTTHTDVVPALDHQFSPRYEGDKLFGRGACDAKGILATMIVTAKTLRDAGKNNFALLFVVGEEAGGVGALKASEDLSGAGIKYLINGEPTEGKIYTAHKGFISFDLRFQGKSCHSGYPHLGHDANNDAIRTCAKILDLELGEDLDFGKETINLGLIRGGQAINVISSSALVQVSIRTVSPADEIIAKIKSLLPDTASLEVTSSSEAMRLLKIPGFEYGVASYGTDIPKFAALNAEAVLYGPGSIFNAHTVNEYISESDIADALQGYVRIYDYLAA